MPTSPSAAWATLTQRSVASASSRRCSARRRARPSRRASVSAVDVVSAPRSGGSRQARRSISSASASRPSRCCRSRSTSTAIVMPRVMTGECTVTRPGGTHLVRRPVDGRLDHLRFRVLGCLGNNGRGIQQDPSTSEGLLSTVPEPERRQHPVIAGLIALVGVGLAIGLLAGGGTLVATRVLGLGADATAVDSTARQSMYLPMPEKTTPTDGASPAADALGRAASPPARSSPPRPPRPASASRPGRRRSGRWVAST